MTLPFGAFNFKVDFYETKAAGDTKAKRTPLCSGRFAEVSGIEATMEPRTIREGGRNFGEVHRAGLTKFSTVILKRGVTSAPDLWKWFELVSNGSYGIRLEARVIHLKPGKDPKDGLVPAMTWTLAGALPVKFKAPTYIAATPDVAVEELHFVHEDLKLEVAS